MSSSIRCRQLMFFVPLSKLPTDKAAPGAWIQSSVRLLCSCDNVTSLQYPWCFQFIIKLEHLQPRKHSFILKVLSRSSIFKPERIDSSRGSQMRVKVVHSSLSVHEADLAPDINTVALSVCAALLGLLTTSRQFVSKRPKNRGRRAGGDDLWHIPQDGGNTTTLRRSFLLQHVLFFLKAIEQMFLTFHAVLWRHAWLKLKHYIIGAQGETL